MATEVRLEFKILIYQDDGYWIAHCLEMDLPAEGSTPSEALQNLIDISEVQISAALEEGNLDSIFSQAPAELLRMYATATDKKFRRRPLGPVKRFEVRELVPA